MNAQLKKRLRLVTIFNLFIISALLSSCSLVRSNDSNNFTRVKYNPHLKLSKSMSNSDLEEIKAEKLKVHKMQNKTAVVSSKTIKTPIYKSIVKAEDGALTAAANQKEEKIADFFHSFNSLKGHVEERGFVTDWSELLKMNITAAHPPISNDDLGTLIWIILAVLLALLLLSILAELGGGLIGTLLAVLLILLILRLLGIV